MRPRSLSLTIELSLEQFRSVVRHYAWPIHNTPADLLNRLELRRQRRRAMIIVGEAGLFGEKSSKNEGQEDTDVIE